MDALEPEIPSTMEWKGFGNATKVAYAQVFQTFREIKKFKVLAFFLLAYLLFYDGVNTIASMASAFGESVLRLDQSMNVLLLLTVNIVAIPMTLVFGKLADIKGTKFALMLALLIYCFVAIVAAGFAPLELDGKEDAERYDFQFEYNEETEEYELLTLYNRGYENWVMASLVTQSLGITSNNSSRAIQPTMPKKVLVHLLSVQDYLHV